MSDKDPPARQRGIEDREGDIEVPSGAFTNLELRATGDIRIGEGSHVAGRTQGRRVEVGQRATVDGEIRAEESLVVGEGAVVTGQIQVGADG
ncbi:hypothetical protein BRD56_01815 [Thermoplasmatales archaeon SW_10_69_26]|nr:MAG: hypothetical protein BRD56_01815 [Thermoplasmatales archaeon SW_10_69_26]